MLSSEQVSDVLRITLEEMAFLDIDPGPPRQPDPGLEVGPVLFLEYHRPSDGAIALFLPKEIKFRIVEAIYGEAWATLSAIQLDDSLLEVLNVLAGRLLSERYGTGGSYTMGLPTILYDPPGDLPGQRFRTFVFHVDAFPITLRWYEVAQ